MNSFYAKFTYAQNTFYLIKEIQLNPKKFSLKSLLLGKVKGHKTAQKPYLEHSLRRDGSSWLQTDTQEQKVSRVDNVRSVLVPSCEHDITMGHDPQVLYWVKKDEKLSLNNVPSVTGFENPSYSASPYQLDPG